MGAEKRAKERRKEIKKIKAELVEQGTSRRVLRIYGALQDTTFTEALQVRFKAANVKDYRTAAGIVIDMLESRGYDLQDVVITTAKGANGGLKIKADAHPTAIAKAMKKAKIRTDISDLVRFRG